MTALLLSRLRPHAGSLALLCLLQVAAVGGTLWLPALNARLIDDGVAQGEVATVWSLGSQMLGVGLAQLLAAALAMVLGARVAAQVAATLRYEVFERVMHLDAAQVRAVGAGSLLTRCGNDVLQLQMLVLTCCTVLLTVPLTMTGAIVLGLREDPGLAWLMAVAVPAVALVLGLFAWWAVPGYRRMQGQIDDVNLVLREQLTGLRVVRAFTRERHEQRRFERANDALVDTSFGVGRLYLSLGPVVALLMNAGGVAVVWFGGMRVSAGEIGIGSVTAFIAYLLQLMSSVLMASAIVMQLPRARVSAGRVRELLDLPPGAGSVRGARTAPVPGRSRDGLRMEGVELRHPGSPGAVLEHVDLHLPPGSHTVLLGSTGSGKTALLQALAAQLTPTRGRVLLEGVDLAEADPALARRRVLLVPQRAHLFGGSVADNLRYGAPDASDDELWEALRAAHADDVVAGLGGLDATLPPGGLTLSGGQRQRLCLARALLARPDHYLVDDALSALDARTEAAVREALLAWAASHGAGVVTATQRLAGVERADRVVVLDRGAVVGLGTHDELAGTCRAYDELLDADHEGALA
ncbi:ABC transporter ATP-binding protein [Nocardioides nanhaiensis]|uniref:ABC transporter ATP-binding protein n=1 Tax=Nocardioides nanhaiensis TaxID=1476871 RepID=A0ABP8VTH3_9ACTN